MIIKKVRKLNWYDFDKKICPICKGEYNNISAHISKTKEKKHRDFFLKHSETITIKKRVLNIKIE